MKKLFLAMCAGLIMFGCAQDPVEAPKADPESTPETRALTSRLVADFSESIERSYGLTVPTGIISVGTPYTFSFTPYTQASVASVRPGATMLESGFGIMKEYSYTWNPVRSAAGTPSSMSIAGHVFTQPGLYEIKGNVAYVYMENGQMKEGEIYTSKTINVTDPNVLNGGSVWRSSSSPMNLEYATYVFINNQQDATYRGSTSNITYAWEVSTSEWGDYTPVAYGVSGSNYNGWPVLEPGTHYYRRKATLSTGYPPVAVATAYSNVISFEFVGNPSAPKPAKPVLTNNKPYIYLSQERYGTFTVSNYSSSEPNTYFEWRTNGRLSPITPSSNYCWGYVPDNGVMNGGYQNYIEMECRVSVNGRVSDWSNKQYVQFFN